MYQLIGMQILATAGAISMGRIRSGWIVSSLVAAFCLFDAFGKFAKPKQVVDAFERTGWPIDLATVVGSLLLICTLLYLIPRTSVLGAILLTGYLGGAVATNLRLHNPLLSNTLFPVYFGILSWIGSSRSISSSQRIGVKVPVCLKKRGRCGFSRRRGAISQSSTCVPSCSA